MKRRELYSREYRAHPDYRYVRGLLCRGAVVWPATEFHHSNLRLPLRLEKVLNKIIVTPRMHGIHHSIVQGETNSNFSTIFSFWDRLHSTLRLNVAQAELSIGVPSYRHSDEINFFQSLLLPFRTQRVWRLPDGNVPARKALSGKSLEMVS